MRYRDAVSLLLVFVAGCYACAKTPKEDRVRTASILKYGAVADGTTLNTAAIQKTIDALASKGGGTVIIPAADGKPFLSGALSAKSARAPAT